MGRTSGRRSGLFKQNHPRAIDWHIDYFGDGVAHRLGVERRRARRAPMPIEERESIVVIVGPFAARRREPALAGAR